MKIYATLLMLPALAACSTNPVIERVEVPVPVPCRVTLPNPPAACTPRSEGRAEWLRCALADATARNGYQSELEAALKACTAF